MLDILGFFSALVHPSKALDFLGFSCMDMLSVRWSFTHAGFSEDFLQWLSEATWIFVYWPSKHAEFPMFSLMM